MTEENGKPKPGRTAWSLGIRPDVDIEIQKIPRGHLDTQGYLLPEGQRQSSTEFVEVAVSNMKGMSTSLSPQALPQYRRPAKFGGNGKKPLWEIDSSKITGDLEAIQDNPTHVIIRPKVTMLLNNYENALANTQNDWIKVK